jgi:hypothetical protein
MMLTYGGLTMMTVTTDIITAPYRTLTHYSAFWLNMTSAEKQRKVKEKHMTYDMLNFIQNNVLIFFLTADCFVAFHVVGFHDTLQLN